MNDNFSVQNKVIDEYAERIGPIGLAIYSLLCRYSGEEGYCFIPSKMIARKLGISQRSVFTYLKRLFENDLIFKRDWKRPDGSVANGEYVYVLRNLDPVTSNF